MLRHFTHFNNLFLAALRRRLRWETALLAAAVLCAVQVGGTKGQRGEPGERDLAATNAAGAAAAPARSFPADRLGFTGISVSSNQVSVSLAWPESYFPPYGTLDLYASTNLLQGAWELAASRDTPHSGSAARYTLGLAAPPGGGSLFLRAGTREDSDLDGVPDAFELMVAGTDPALRDTDGDGLADGSDPDPLAPDQTLDADGDGIPDCYEAFWFGGVSAVNCATNRCADGFTLQTKIYAGMNPTNPAPECGFFSLTPTNTVCSWKLCDAFEAPATNAAPVYERTLAVRRTSPLQQFFVSSNPRGNGQWWLEGGELAWEDSGGARGSAPSSGSGDSLRLALSAPPVTSITVRLRGMAGRDTLRSPQPLYLVAYAPVLRPVAGPLSLPGGGEVYAVTSGLPAAVGIAVDRSHRPSTEPPAAEESSDALIAGWAAQSPGLSWSGGALAATAPGVYPLPEIPLPVTNPPPAAARSLLVLAPRVAYGGDCLYAGWRLRYDGASGSYSAEPSYPLDRRCLAEGWARLADGGWSCGCAPAVSTGIDPAPDWLTVSSNAAPGFCSAEIRAGTNLVWRGEAAHTPPEAGAPDDGAEPFDDGCGDCSGGCADGDCGQLEVPEAAPLRFRIPLGSPRAGQVSGFLYFVSDGVPALTPQLFATAARADASVTDALSGSVRTVECSDAGGRGVEIAPFAGGLRVEIRAAPGGALEHTWFVTNAPNGAVCFDKISRLGNRMECRCFAKTGTVWTCSDAVSGAVETAEIDDRLNTPAGFSVESRRVYGADGRFLAGSDTERVRIGSGDGAVLRETARTDYTGWNTRTRYADYWDDPQTARHGRLRLLRGNCAPWEFRDYDRFGRETVRVVQRNASPVPAWLTHPGASVGPGFDGLTESEATVFGYEPLDGDSADPGDFRRPRSETRYAVSPVTGGAGVEAVVTGRAWRRYARGESGGVPAVTEEEWRAAGQGCGSGDPANAYSRRVSFDANAPGVPFALRGQPVGTLGADGVLEEFSYSWAGGALACAAQKSFNGNPFPARTVTRRDAAFLRETRRAEELSANGAVLGAVERVYDEKGRLRGESWADGTSATNAYSCCRLLWGRDRAGRETRRSAVTGRDRLYYAEEDVWLAGVSTNGGFRVTQHFMDELGRETNTVVYAGAVPGEAVSSAVSEGRELSSETAVYPFAGGDYCVRSDARGKTVTTVENVRDGYSETVETTATNGVAVLVETRRNWFGGGSSVRREWGGKWSEERRFDEYAADGSRVEYVVTESSDCGTVTNSVSTYDLLGRLVSAAVPGANGSTIVTANSYDGASTRILSAVTTGSPVVTYGYNARGERTSTSQDGKSILNETSYETISQQIYRVTTSVRMTGGVTNSVQVRKVQLTGLSDALRSRTVSIAESGRETVTETAFDAATGVLTSVSQIGASTPVTARSVHGIALDQTSIDGTSEMSYDAFGRNVSIAMSSAGGVTNRVDFLEYDQSGNVVRRVTDFIDGLVAEATAEYDMLGREVRRTDALGNVAVTAYDALGRTVSTSGDAYPILSGYDTAGRKTHVFTTRNGGTTWDETIWEFDPASGVNTAKQYADGSRIAYDYTDNGKKTRTTWARGTWRENAYNARNLVSGTTYSGTVTPLVAYTYADSGKTASATLSDGTSYAYGYDDRLLNTNESVTVGGEAFSVSRTYDVFRRAKETAAVITNVRHSAKVRLYDSEDRVCGYALTNAAGRGVSVSFAYDGSYVTNTVYTMPNGSVFSARLSREAGRRNLVTRRDYFFGGQSIYWYSTDYDLLNRPTNATDSVSLVREWLYNRRSELVAATVGADRYGYAYDSIGNRIWSAASAVTNSYTANSLNQYASISPGTNFVYDADGNMTSDGTFSYSYDAENRLLAAYPLSPAVGSLAVENRYDHRHRRSRKIVKQYDGSDWETQETHTFVWDGNNIVLEKVEFANGTTRTFEYFWGVDKSGSEQGAGGVEGLLAVSVDGVFYIPCYDHNGNIILYVSETGSIAAQYTYDPYGNVVETYGNLAEAFSFGFSTKYHDRETGMVGYQRRFYRPDLGRWLNRDPIEEDGGENLYVFCQNNAIFYYDPNGESFEDVSNFCAGAGDSLTFGLTRLFRRGLNRMIEGTWDDPADIESSAYSAGEYTEIAVEIAVSLGGATLRHVAKHSSRQMLEKGARNAYRNAHNISGGVVHHINPIKGHPPVKGMKGGKIARYPLPFEWAARGEWNLTWYATAAEHNAAHRWMMQLESLDKFREITLGTRQLGNRIINKLNSSSDTKCWDSIDLNVYFYYSIDSGANINGIPESVSISIEQYGRRQ